MDPKKKFFFFHRSKHFCAVPWNQIKISPQGAVQTCSKGTPIGNINTQPLDEILYGKPIHQIKQDILDDRLNKNCVSCHDLSTDNEHYDRRDYYNPMFKRIEVEYENLNEFQLNAIDLHWDNTCNLKCVYCNPYHSSLIAAEQGIRFDKLNQENIDKIIAMVVAQQYHMKELYLSGGEPLLIKHNHRLLQLIDNKDLPIRINSNITMATDKNPVFAELKKFKNVCWVISAEAKEKKFNYIRNGSDWDQVLQNLDNIKNLNHQLRLNSVFFIANVLDLFDTVKYFIETYNITDITVNQLHSHAALQARNAPQSLKIQALQALEDLLKSGLIAPASNLYYNIDRCRRELTAPEENTVEYQRYFDHLDSMRNTNWREVFPEIVR
jgi:radical SAM protein with 4Fe4S-binding SPASM domain